MATCPNGDPNFNRILNLAFNEVTPDIRKKLFYGVCVPTRIVLYLTVLYFRDNRFIPYIVGLAGLLGVFNLVGSFWNVQEQYQWWSKRFQAIISILLVIVCALVIMGKIGTIYIPALLFISLAGGIIQSFITPIC